MGAADGPHRGRCLCGAVSFAITGPLAPAVACHCTQCRRQSGHYWVSTNVAERDLMLDGGEAIVWHRSSDVAERGFCGKCGSFLFWRRPGSGRIAVSGGSLDASSGIVIDRHIFVADKGDYYEIEDDAPRFPGDD